MKVVYVCESFGGGVARHLEDLVLWMADHGVEPVVIYSNLRMDAISEAGLANFKAKGIRTRVVKMERAVGKADYADLQKLKAALREEGGDLIHAHSSKAGALTRLAKPKAPVIYTPHAFATLDPTLGAKKRKLYQAAEKFLAKRTAQVIAVSQLEADHAVSLGIPRDRVSMIVNGVDPHPPVGDREGQRKRFGFEEDDIVIGFVGRFSTQKAPEALLDAFAGLADDFPRAKLLMCGFGESESDLRARVAALGDRVQFAINENAKVLMPAMDIFVQPSLYEGCSYVPLEAASYGIPIVATKTGFAEDLVEHGRNGFLADVGDQEGLSIGIRQLLESSELRRQMGDAIFQTVSGRYTIDKMAEETQKIYLKTARSLGSNPP